MLRELKKERRCGIPTSEAKIGGLSELLQNLGRAEPKEEEIEETVRRIILMPLDDPELELGNEETQQFVRSWTKALRRSLTLDPPCARVLCGFGSVADTIYQLDQQGDEIGVFLKWVADKLGFLSVDQVMDTGLQKSQNSDLMRGLTKDDGKASDLLEVVALLFWCMQNGGKKPVLTKPDVQRQMLEYVEWRRQQSNPQVMTDMIGGASGNMCYVLRHLGLDVVAYWLYHPEPVAKKSPYCLLRLIPKSGAKKEELPAGQKGIYFDANNQMHEDPIRRSVSFEFPQGMIIKKSDQSIAKTAHLRDRAIYQIPIHRSPSRPWSAVFLRVPAPGGGTIDLAVDRAEVQRILDHDGWPFIPLFATWHIQRDQLVIEVTDDQTLRQIGEQINYFILSGVHALGFELMKTPLRLEGGTSGPSLGSVVKHHLIRQLQVLVDSGVVIHTEIPSMTPEVFDLVGDVIRGRVRSVGLNDDDLLRVTGEDAYRGTRFFYAPLSWDEQSKADRYRAVFRRFQRADHLARELDVDELYMHGNDVDLVKRRQVVRGAIWRETEANLLAKAAVVLALMQRVAGTSPVAPISPILTVEGLYGFLKFARDFAHNRHPENAERRRQIFEEIIECKYFFERNPEAYSVIVTPVLWPD